MSLRVWLPLNGDLRNQGLSDFIVEPLVTPTYVAGKIGKCYQRANSSSQLTNGLRINNNLVDLLGNQASIAIWVKPLGTHTHYNGTFISSGNWNASRWAFGVSQDNTKVDVLCGGHNNYIDCTVPVNEWTHLVSVFDNGTCKLYKNGVYVGEKTGQAAFKSDTTWTGIGRETYATGYFGFNGCLNDLRIYDHCLSEKEIKEITKGLILHYKLYDLMGNINDNLAKNSKMLNIDSGINNQNISKRGTATLETIDNNFVRVKATAAWQGFSLWSNSLNLEVGTTYTYSFYAYTNSEDNTNAAISFYPMMYNSSGSRDTSSKLPISVLGSSFQNVNSRYIEKLTTKPTLYWATFTWNQTMADILSAGGKIELSIQIHGTFNSGRIDYLQLPKLEVGDNPTMWCPSFSEIGTIPFTQLEDVSGYGHNGQIVSNINISSDTMRYNTSALFDGVDDCIIVPYNAICPENIFTINLWFKKDALGSKKYETLFGGPSGFEMDTRAGASTALSLYMASTRGGNAATGLQLNTWYMVTMVRDGINERYYINGELKKEIEAKAMPTGVYRIGAWASNTGQNYYGNISDFRIYCTALSADDIKELYQTSASIDDKQNFYSRELSNSLHDTTSITQAGIALADDFVEDAVAAIKDDRSIESNCFYEY